MKSKSLGQGKQTIDLNNLSKQELIDIIVSQHNTKPLHNKIEVTDFSVETTEPLSVCEETINRLIQKHKGFAELRKAKAQLESSMFNNIGIG